MQTSEHLLLTERRSALADALSLTSPDKASRDRLIGALPAPKAEASRWRKGVAHRRPDPSAFHWGINE